MYYWSVTIKTMPSGMKFVWFDLRPYGGSLISTITPVEINFPEWLILLTECLHIDVIDGQTESHEIGQVSQHVKMTGSV